MDKIRVGLIGTGGMMQGHIARALSIEGVEITALADPAPDRIETTKKRNPALHDAAVFSDHKALLKSGLTDAVMIASPHTCHFEQIMDSFAHGQHVMCEKPMVCTIPHAHQIIKDLKTNGRTFLIAYQRHYAGHIRYIRRMIQEGYLGDVQYVSAILCQNWYRGTKGTWRQLHSLSGGGQLNDSGSHIVDSILWTTGLAVESVSAFADNFDTEVDINSAVSLKFTSGAQGTISIIGNCPTWWEDQTYVGTKGAIYYRNGKLTHVNGVTGETSELVQLRDSGTPVENFIGAIRGKQEIEVPALCGLRVIELTEAAWQSAAKHGVPVKVPSIEV